ncbi:MGH1-like glycoside hydrolase domain-containing protein [Streptomyces sp. 184]|uniref:MGH1-like glycoside hydrolase domain-containing protein n=1 Tax=Streptomyces sp. 184 TaxID=1827526 RepID=UPI003891F3E5
MTAVPARGRGATALSAAPGGGSGAGGPGPVRADDPWRAAAAVLLGNWTGSSTVPSRTLYPHQWSWDSAFVAIGLRHLSPRRAQRELEMLLGAQWGDGRIPHIVFNPAVPHAAYFPGPDFWRSAGSGGAGSSAGTGTGAGARAGAPAHTQTSGLVQPPVHALAALLVHRADPAASARRGFLARVYPRLLAWHRYLTEDRDLGGGGLAAIVHPWESGMDNSPCWDGPLARIEPAPAASFHRADLDHGDPADRPTDLDYGRYVRLAADYRDAGYADAGVRHGFAVEDPCVNALLIASEEAMAEIAAELAAAGPAPAAAPGAHRERAARLTEALVARLWDAGAGIFRCRDLRTDRPVEEYSVAGLTPLLASGLPPAVAGALRNTLAGEHFRVGELPLVASYDLKGRAFDRTRYWRGPAWFNTAWLLERGLRRHGADGTADALRRAVLTGAAASGFAEYVDPLTGTGRGARDFSWTAALALDLAARDAAWPAARGAWPAAGPR